MPNELTLMEKADQNFVSGATPKPLVPTTFSAIVTLSEIMVAARMAPKDFTSEMCTIAIMHGMEVGLTPMASLQSIAVINGRPTIWGDGALAICQASGLMDYFQEIYEGEKGSDDYKAICIVRRKNMNEPAITEFSVADAKKAKLWTKSGPWSEYPYRMMRMRARAWALRDSFADVFKGLAIREEIDDIPEYTGRLNVGRARPGKAITDEDNPLNDDVIDHDTGEVTQASTAEPDNGIGGTGQPAAAETAPVATAEPARRGRPKGSTNKPKEPSDGEADQGKTEESSAAGQNAPEVNTQTDRPVVEERSRTVPAGDERPAEPRSTKVYPVPAFIAGAETAATHEALTALWQQHITPVFDSLPPDMQAKVNRAKVEAEDRLDAADAEAMEQEESKPQISSGGERAEPPAKPGFDVAIWGERDAKILTNALKGLSSQPTGEDLQREIDYWRAGPISLRPDAVKQAFDKLCLEARQRFMPGRG